MLPYSLTKDSNGNPVSLTVVVNNSDVQSTTRSNPNWDLIIQALREGNDAELVRLISLKNTIESFSSGNIVVRDNEVLYKNQPLHGMDVDHLLSFVKEKLPTEPLIAFLENKMQNSSYKAINMMYRFVNTYGLTLTPDGYFIGFKGVGPGYWSKNGNKSTVVLHGQVDEGGHILNKVGEYIEVERRCVEDNPALGCAQGLHVGSLEYAKGWAGSSGHVMVVKVHPKDVVSVPNAEDEKMRVCAYTVIGEHQWDRGPLNVPYTEEYETEDDEDPWTCPECSADLSENGECEECGWVFLQTDQADEESCPECGIRGCEGECQDEALNAESEQEYDDGYDVGLKDGRAKTKRQYYAGDELSNCGNPDYIRGYNNGYRKGRYHKE